MPCASPCIPPDSMPPLALLVLMLASAPSAVTGAELPPVTPERLVNGTDDPGHWLTYGGNYANWRYSPLARITPENVARLAPTWVLQTGVEGQVANSPIVADGTLYFTAAYNHLYALDAETGEQRWHYTHPMPSDLRLCCGPANRGVAIAGDRVFMATLDARLLAFDRRSGNVLWNIAMDDYQRGYSATAAPLVVKDLVIVGSGGGEFSSRGFIDAYDAATGRRRWRRYTVPAAGEPGAETWAGDSWKRGGAPAWLTGTYDAENHVLYWSTGNPSPLFNGDARGGDNLYSNSILALDPDTGDLRWHFQATPHDVWDYDATNGIVLFDTDIAGQPRRVLAQPNRNGYLYLLDAATGTFLHGARYVDKLNWSTGLTAAGRPVVDPRYVPTAEGLQDFVCPGALGGNNGSFTYAYSPRARTMYVPVIESCHAITKEDAGDTPGEIAIGGSFGDTDADKGEAYGQLVAIDPVSGEIRWKTRDAYPLVGGALATAGGLVFTGNQQGYALALDAAGGKVLWRFQMGAGMRSQPVTWEQGGRQYVAIGSGSGGAAVALVGEPPLRGVGSALMVFSVPD
ncbi:MAG: PQQ-dependent dehydrogenase, methanol/ethanol family [Gammaproteobacteria bacterium]